jgi:hypothetical protein
MITLNNLLIARMVPVRRQIALNKVIYAITAMLLTIGCVEAQTPNVSWAKPLTDTGNNYGLSQIYTATGQQGDTFVTSQFNAPTISFGSQTLTNLAWSTNIFPYGNVFVAKYGMSGDLLWVQRIGGSNGAYVSACAVDNVGNLIIGGFLNSSSTWFGTNLITRTAVSNVLFVAKFDPQGSLNWVRQLAGGAGPLRVALDASANIHVASEFITNLVIGATVLTNQNLNYYLVSDFVAEYSNAGDLLWTGTVDFTSSKDLDTLAVDAEGNTYLADCSSGIAHFGTSSLTNSGLFVAKYDATGALVWAKRLWKASRLWGIAVGAQGDFRFFADNTAAKYDSSLNLVWSNSISLTPYDPGGSLILDPTGNTWVIGYGNSKTLTFGSQMLTSSDPNRYDNPSFMAKYDAAGDLLWAKVLDSTNANIYAVGTVDSTGSLSLYGEASGTNALDLDGSLVSAPTNSSDFFFTARIPGPSLSVQLVSAQVVIWWPTNAVGLGLECTADLSIGSWLPVTNAPVIVGDQFSVTNNVSVGNQFYRLRNF